VSKTGVVGRLISISAVGGVIAAAMALPVVATTGVVLRDQANKAAAPASASFGTIPQRSEILDANGHLLAYVYGVNLGNSTKASGIDRQPVTYDQIAPAMGKAVVAIEDNRFWTEGALDVKGTLRALINDLQHKPVQGGSSITQQYVKNMLILTAPNAQQAQAAYEATLSRKLHELRLAISVAHQQSKQQILTGYLNDAYFGNLAYGIEVAAETYFGTSAAKLTLPQAALLAGMVENPTGYNPFTNPATATKRRNTVLARMVQTGVLSSKDAAAAEKAPLGVHNTTPDNGCTAAIAGSSAFFCNYAEQALVRDSTIAKTPQARAKLLATGGLKIYTTLDEEDQNAAANAVNSVLPDGQQRGHRSARPAGHGLHQGHGRGPALRQQRHHHQLRGGQHLRRLAAGRSDRFLVQAVHPGHRAGAGRTVRLDDDRSRPDHGHRLHQLPRPVRRIQQRPIGRVPGDERRGPRLHVHPVALHRHHAVGEHVLRQPGEEGRPVQRGQDRRGHGRAPGRRHVAAEERPWRRRSGGRRPVLHARCGQRVPADHGDGVRHRGGAG
jgi:membrane peptidoglycan carboxypeptidase